LATSLQLIRWTAPRRPGHILSLQALPNSRKNLKRSLIISCFPRIHFQQEVILSSLTRKPDLYTGLHHLRPFIFDTRLNAESHKFTNNNLQIRLFLYYLIWIPLLYHKWIASQPFQYRKEEDPNQCNCQWGSWRHPFFCTGRFPGLSTKKESP